MRKSPHFLLPLVFVAAFGFGQTKQEFRGVWLTNVDSNVLLSDASIAQAMDYLASIGINVVFPVVWNKGYTLFPSQTMAETFGSPYTIWPTVAGRDPFQRVVIEAHRNGIEVIPWFEFGFSANYVSDTTNLGHILSAKPAWTLRNKYGRIATKDGAFPQFVWMSGVNPEVQQFMISLMMEALDGYDVDGVQGDDRLPAMPVDGGYDSVTVALYKSEHGGASPPMTERDVAWTRWRADKLTGFFRQLRDSVKARSFHYVLSSSPSVYPWGYQEYLQDAKTWLDSSICDNLIPQVYRYSYSEYVFELDKSLSYVPVGKRSQFYPAVLGKIGAYLIDTAYLNNAVAANRARGLKGESWFFYEAFPAESGLRGAYLKGGHYREPASVPWRDGTVRRPKASIVNENDPGASPAGGWMDFSNFPQGFKPGFLMAADTGHATITYDCDVPVDAWYDVYAYIIANTINTTVAPYTIYSATDSTVVLFDQFNAKNNGWQKIGEAFLLQGTRTVLKLTNENIGSGKRVIADAAMVMINRRLSPDAVVSGLEADSRRSEVIPDGFVLQQNYPNPFNPTTTISFGLPAAARVTVMVYDMLGREVAVPMKGQDLGPGWKKIAFDGGALSGGIYFCRVEAIPATGDFSAAWIRTNRMVLVK
jgi:uncharacterized lipoprotein YddW (UPF0748 family)